MKKSIFCLVYAVFFSFTVPLSYGQKVNFMSSHTPSEQTSQSQNDAALNMAKSQSIEVIHGQGKPTHAVIWLHGLGASANDFPPVVPHLGLSDKVSVRFIFPQAPNRAITINGGMVMPGWYDIKGTDLSDKEDLAGMTQSRYILDALIADQMAQGIPSKHIIVAGFSQGGAVAYYTGIRSKHLLGGIMALSTYLPFATQAGNEHTSVNVSIPVLAMHGLQDPVVPISMGKLSIETLKQLGYGVQWQTYTMEHSVSMEQLVDIGSWMNEVFAAR